MSLRAIGNAIMKALSGKKITEGKKIAMPKGGKLASGNILSGTRAERLKKFKQKRFTRTLIKKTPLKTRKKLSKRAAKAIGTTGSKEQKASYESLIRNENFKKRVLRKLDSMPPETQRRFLEKLYSKKNADKFTLAYFARKYGHYDLAFKYTVDCYKLMDKIEQKGIELYPGNKELSAKAKASGWADIYYSLYRISKNAPQYTTDFNALENHINRMEPSFRHKVKVILKEDLKMKESEINIY